MKILIVIDNMLTRKMVRSVLSSEGYEVFEARTGHAALALARAHAPQLILQDLALPDTDGSQLLDRIRALPRCAPIPVLALTALEPGQHEAGALAAGFDGYLEKRIDPARLLNMVRLHAGKQRPAPERLKN